MCLNVGRQRQEDQRTWRRRRFIVITTVFPPDGSRHAVQHVMVEQTKTNPFLHELGLILLLLPSSEVLCSVSFSQSLPPHSSPPSSLSLSLHLLFLCLKATSNTNTSTAAVAVSWMMIPQASDYLRLPVLPLLETQTH